MAEQLLKAHSLYLRNRELISRKKNLFRGYFEFEIPGVEGVRTNPKSTYERQSALNFFLYSETWNMRYLLKACEAKSEADYSKAVSKLTEFGNNILKQSDKSILSYRVADGFLSSFLLYQIPYNAVLQFELAHAVVCDSGDTLLFGTAGRDNSNSRIDVRDYAIRLSTKEVGRFNISYSYARANEALLQIIEPEQATVYYKDGEERAELKTMGLQLELDGSHFRDMIGWNAKKIRSTPQELVASICRNILAVDFDGFVYDLRHGIPVNSSSGSLLIKAEFDSLLPSAFAIRIASYPRQSDGLVQFSAKITAKLNDGGYVMRLVLPNFGVSSQIESSNSSAFTGVASILDANGNFKIDLNAAYSHEHPLHPGLKN
ncbi:MAG: hypothetical protein NTV88_00020 [Candidatus Micrarchaeota archaeon]|nr:hypothetical protein [Candidatus Micrarchaeota archaeon]